MQHVHEYKGDTLREVRAERFDPSQPDARRWQLLSINDRPPTPQECRAFDARKNAKPRKRVLSPLSYVDMDRIRVVDQNDQTVTLDVPLRGDVSLFIPFEAISARVEIDRRSRTLSRLEVGLAREMCIAFGLARVTRLAMNVQMQEDPARQDEATAMGTAQPHAQASATMKKLGRRVEFTWSGFSRVRS